MTPGLVLTPSKSTIRSKDAPVGVFPRGFAHSDKPAYYISIEEARALRKTGAWYSCNSGKDIGEAGEPAYTIPEDKQKGRWKNVTYMHCGEPIGYTVKELLA